MTSLGTAEITLKLDQSQFQAGLAQIAPTMASATKAAGAAASTAMGGAGSAAGNAFATNLKNPLSGIPNPFAAAGAAAANAFSTQAKSGITTIPQVWGDIGNKAGRMFAAANEAELKGLASAFAKGLANTPQAFAAAGAAAGRAFESSVVPFAKTAATAITKPFADIGAKIGNSLKTQLQGTLGQGIGQGIGQNLASGVLRGAGALGGALISTKNLSEFDAASRKSSTLTEDLGNLQKSAFAVAKELGNTTTAAKLVDSAYDVLSSGFSKTADVMAILKASQMGAIGGFSEVNKVANATTSVLNAYGLSAKDAASVVQQMSGTQNAGKLTIDEYATNIGKIASTAAQAGVKLSEVNGIISVSTAKGVRVTSAFDGLRQAIASMLKPSKEASDTAEELGIKFDAATLRSKGIVGVLQDLKAKGSDTPETLVKLFGSVEAVAAIAPVAGKGLEDYAKALETIKNTDTKDAFDKVRKGMAEQQKAFGNKAIDLDVKLKTGVVGDILGSGVRIANSGLDLLIAGIEKLNNAYNSLNPQAKGFVNAVGGGLAVIAGVAAAVVAIGAAWAIAGSALAAGAALLGGLATGLGVVAVAAAPIALPLVAIGGAVYGIAKAFGATNTTAFVAALTAAGVALAAVFGPAVIAAIGAGITAVTVSLYGMATAAVAALVPFAPFIAAAVAVGAALYGLYLVFEKFKPTITAWAQGIGAAAQSAGSAIGNWVSSAGTALSNWASSAISAVSSWGKSLGNSISQATSATVSTLASWGQSALDVTKSVGQYFFDLGVAIGKVLTATIGLLGTWAGNALRPIAEWAGNALKPIADWGAKALSTITNWISSTIAAYLAWQSRVLATFANWGQILYAANAAFWSRLSQAIGTALSQLFSAIGNWAKSVTEAIGRMVTAAAQAIARWIDSLNIVRPAINAVGSIVTGLKNIVISAWDAVVSATVALGRKLKEIFDGIVNAIKGLADWIIDLPNKFLKAADAINIFNKSQQQIAPYKESGATPGPLGKIPNPGSAVAEGLAAIPKLTQSQEVLVASTDLTGLGIGNLAAATTVNTAKLESLIAKTEGKRGSAGGGVSVRASEFSPGGGGDEGKQQDIRGRRLLPTDFAVATPLAGRNGGIPYGSTVRVTNPETGKSVTAIARDGGPYVPGRQLDLTTAVARAIGFRGLGTLKLEIISTPDGNRSRTIYTGEASRLRQVGSVKPDSGVRVPFAGESEIASSSSSAAPIASPVRGLTIQQLINYTPALPVQRPEATRNRKGQGLGRHNAIDLDRAVGAGLGDPVFAAFSGTATNESTARYGGRIRLVGEIAGKKYDLLYDHLARETVNAFFGRANSRQVTAGERLATVGTFGRKLGDGTITGNTEHVDLKGRINGQQYSDPRQFFAQLLRDGQAGGSSNDRAVTEARIKRDLAQRDLERARQDLETTRRETPSKRRGGVEAHNRRLEDAERKVTRKQDQLEDAERKYSAAVEKAGRAKKGQSPEELRSAEIASVRAKIDPINSRYNLRKLGVDELLAAGQISPQAAETSKAELDRSQYRELQKLWPQVQDLRNRYGKFADAQSAIDAIETSIRSAGRDANTAATSATSGVRKQQSDEIKNRIESIFTTKTSRIEEQSNRRQSLQISTATEQANVLKIQQEENRRLQAAKADVERFRATRAPDDAEGRLLAAELLAKIARHNAETISAGSASDVAGFTRKIEDQLTNEKNAQADITYRRQTGDITAKEEAVLLLELKQRTNAEIQKSLPLLEAYRAAQTNPDVLTQIDELIRRMTTLNGEARQAADEFDRLSVDQKVEDAKTRVTAIIKDGERQQLAVQQRRDVDPSTTSELQAQQEILKIKQEMVFALQAEVQVLDQLRSARKDPAYLEQINEEIARIRAIEVETIKAARAQEELNSQSTILGRTTKSVTTALDEGFRSVAKSAFNGFKDLGSILDSILNKLADIAINAALDALFPSGGGGGGGGDFWGSLIGGVTKIFGFAGGGEIMNYAEGGPVGLGKLSKAMSLYQGIENAKRREGNRAVTIVANEKERVLTPKQTEIYERMLKDGTIAQAEQVYGFATGGQISRYGAIGSSATPVARGSSDQQKPIPIEVTRINEIDYVSMDQLQAILAHQLPLTAKAGAAITDQNLSNTAYRSQYGIK